MKASINGINFDLEIKKGEMALLNIHNVVLYGKVVDNLLNDLANETANEIVFLNDEERLLKQEIEYIHDLRTYSFNNKSIVEAVVKAYGNEVNGDIKMKSNEVKLYYELLNPIIEQINLLEVDYDYKKDLDQAFFVKIPGFSFNENETLLDKLISIIKINTKLFGKKLFVVNSLISSLTTNDFELLNDYVEANGILLFLIDYLCDSDVVITNNVCINEEYGVYSVRNDMI